MPVLAYHCIFSAYGFWLPNDPRGSWSEVIRSWDLLRHGIATKTDARHSVAHSKHNQQKRQSAKNVLKHDPIRFTGKQAKQIGTAFRMYADKSKVPIHALAIMPDHIHIVVGRHHNEIRQTIGRLKQAATLALRQHADEDEVLQKISPWATGGWHVYLSSPRAVIRAIEYVEENPTHAGLPRQSWLVVQRFQG